MIQKSSNEKKVRQAIYNHLVSSPYHNLDPSEAEALADGAVLEQEVYEDGAGGHHEEEEDEQRGAKRARRDEGASASSSARPLELDLQPSKLAQRQLPQAGTVTLRTSELAIILDSVKRAAVNVRSAEKVCENAATSFRMEATALEAAHAALSMQILQQRGSER